MDVDTDYYLVTHQNWLRLTNLYGGGPEIPIYQYFEEETVAGFGAQQTTQEVRKHDLYPIKVKIHVFGRYKEKFIAEHE